MGRHLYDPPGSTLGKEIKPGELRTVFDNGLKVFPIHQDNARRLSDFTYSQGCRHAPKAHQLASDHGVNHGTVIHFAVDCDVTREEIDSATVPCFHGVSTGLAGQGRKHVHGVYGSRNVYTDVTSKTFARYSFVSGMSWSFSGNLGFTLPPNRSFDRTEEFGVANGGDAAGWAGDPVTFHAEWRNSEERYASGRALCEAKPAVPGVPSSFGFNDLIEDADGCPIARAVRDRDKTIVQAVKDHYNEGGGLRRCNDFFQHRWGTAENCKAAAHNALTATGVTLGLARKQLISPAGAMLSSTPQNLPGGGEQPDSFEQGFSWMRSFSPRGVRGACGGDRGREVAARRHGRRPRWWLHVASALFFADVMVWFRDALSGGPDPEKCRFMHHTVYELVQRAVRGRGVNVLPAPQQVQRALRPRARLGESDRCRPHRLHRLHRCALCVTVWTPVVRRKGSDRTH